MQRGALVGVVLGVGVLTAALLFLTSPSTGPDLDEAPEAAPVAPVRTAKAPPARPAVAKAPGARRPALPPVRRPTRDGLPVGTGREMARLPKGPGGMPHKGATRTFGPAAMRDRYTSAGEERIMNLIDDYAADNDWEQGKHEEVREILLGTQEAGRELLEQLQAGEVERVDGAKQLRELRVSEVDQLQEALGDEAEVFATKTGIAGKRMFARGDR